MYLLSYTYMRPLYFTCTLDNNTYAFFIQK